MSILVLSDEHHKARTDHLCDMCGRTINPGETYRRQRNIWEDGPYTWKECEHCEALLRAYPEIIGDYYDYDEGIGSWVLEEWKPSTAEGVEHRRQWLARWRDDGELLPVPGVVS